MSCSQKDAHYPRLAVSGTSELNHHCGSLERSHQPNRAATTQPVSRHLHACIGWYSARRGGIGRKFRRKTFTHTVVCRVGAQSRGMWGVFERAQLGCVARLESSWRDTFTPVHTSVVPSQIGTCEWGCGEAAHSPHASQSLPCKGIQVCTRSVSRLFVISA